MIEENYFLNTLDKIISIDQEINDLENSRISEENREYLKFYEEINKKLTKFINYIEINDKIINFLNEIKIKEDIKKYKFKNYREVKEIKNMLENKINIKEIDQIKSFNNSIKKTIESFNRSNYEIQNKIKNYILNQEEKVDKLISMAKIPEVNKEIRQKFQKSYPNEPNDWKHILKLKIQYYIKKIKQNLEKVYDNRKELSKIVNLIEDLNDFSNIDNLKIKYNLNDKEYRLINNILKNRELKLEDLDLIILNNLKSKMPVFFNSLTISIK